MSKKPKVRFFSDVEKAIMDKWAAMPKSQHFPAGQLEAFCKKYGRKPIAVYQYVSKVRSAQTETAKPVVAKKKAPVSKLTQDLSTLRRNEFVIPINQWELRSENGQTSLILKFK